jgi:hypothetical protein
MRLCMHDSGWKQSWSPVQNGRLRCLWWLAVSPRVCVECMYVEMKHTFEMLTTLGNRGCEVCEDKGFLWGRCDHVSPTMPQTQSAEAHAHNDGSSKHKGSHHGEGSGRHAQTTK